MDIDSKDFTKEYLKNLLAFSKFISHRSAEFPVSRNNQLYAFSSSLASVLSRYLKQLGRRSSKLNAEISINPNIVFRYDNPKGNNRKFHVAIGGIVKIKNSLITEQSLCINLMLEHTKSCVEIPDAWRSYPIQEGFHVLRRFHFDFDIRNDDNSKPKFHLQYGGNFEDNYIGLEKIHYHLFSPIDTPRLPQQPYDIVMLLDFMLREFDLKGRESANDKRWNEIVIQSEKLWLKPYYERLLTRLDTTRNSPLHRIY